MTYSPKLYRITAQTNLHVGSGDQNFGIIDNLVQRDAVSNLPVIHGSSLKGALREFFTLELGKDSELVNYVFGIESTKSDQAVREGKSPPTNQAGKYRFFDAHLLSLPVRSNVRPFFRATCPLVAAQLIELLGHLQQSLPTGQKGLNALATLGDDFCHHLLPSPPAETPVLLEDNDKQAQPASNTDLHNLSELVGEPVAVVDNQKFATLCDDNHLPVIARNSLEDGRSTNLWYEQIVPRQTSFYCLIMVPEVDNKHFAAFEKLLTGAQFKQIGANASIGYGFCQFEALSLTPNPTSNESET